MRLGMLSHTLLLRSEALRRFMDHIRNYKIKYVCLHKLARIFTPYHNVEKKFYHIVESLKNALVPFMLPIKESVNSLFILHILTYIYIPYEIPNIK